MANRTPAGTVHVWTPAVSNVTVWVGGAGRRRRRGLDPRPAARIPTDDTHTQHTRPSSIPSWVHRDTVAHAVEWSHAAPGSAGVPVRATSSVDVADGGGGHLRAMNRPCTPVIIIQ